MILIIHPFKYPKNPKPFHPLSSLRLFPRHLHPATATAMSSSSITVSFFSRVLPTLSITKPSYPFPSFPTKLSLFSSSNLTTTALSFRKIPSLTPLVARTTEWDALEQGEEGEGEEVEEGFELGLSDGDGEEVVVAEGGESEGYDGEYPEPPEEAKLFVGNLPFDVDSENLAKLFEQAGVVEISEVIYNRNTDQSRGFAFVTMSTVEEAEKAVEMFNRRDYNGRLLTVNKAAPRGSPVERPPRDFAPSFRIYIGNLPWQVDDARLEEMFSDHGKVVDARVVYDRESGRSRGFGFVTMSSREEQDQAISALDGQSLDGRTIRVNAAEERPRRGSF